MVCNGQNLREGLLAGVAEELIVGHTDLPRSWNCYSWILDLRLEQVQLGSVSTTRRRFYCSDASFDDDVSCRRNLQKRIHALVSHFTRPRCSHAAAPCRTALSG